MPVVGIPVKMLLERLDDPPGREELVEHLFHLGCDVEGYATVRRFRCQRCENLMEITETENPPVLCDRCAADYKEEEELLQELEPVDVIRMELLAVRPDMFDPGGLARVLRNYLGQREEPATYELAPPTITVEVDPDVGSEACPRPNIACAVVRGITLTDDRIKVIMKLQENLHWALGRDRKHASIGVYDLDTVEGPDFNYTSVEPDKLRFVPLGLDPEKEEDALTPAEILERHPKGMAYARLLSGFQRYPLLCDSWGRVLSMPPIINSEQTRVRGNSKNFFIDVTGTGQRIVNKCLNILVTSLAELDPEASIEQVIIQYGDWEEITPDLTPQEVVLDPEEAARAIGVDLTPEQVEQRLGQMGHVATPQEDGSLLVQVPAWRNDIMHPIDLIEDAAIAYGYHNIEPSLVPTMTVGAELPIEGKSEVVRRAMTGLGFMEVLTLILSSPEVNYDALRLPQAGDCVLIEHPISVEQTIIRTTLIPGLLDTFGVNANQELPQQIFEVGNISLLDPEQETGAREQRMVAAGGIGPRVDYAMIRSACEALLREFGWSLAVEPDDAPCFIEGRGAAVLASRVNEQRRIGLMGELHPEVLERFKLIQPVAIFEVNLERML